jgi:antitoxin HigA-1
MEDGGMSYERRGPAGWAVHPGEILQEEFLRPLGLSGYALARAIGVNAQRVSDIKLGKNAVTASMAVRLGKFFNTTPEFWMNLQDAYELAEAQRELKDTVSKIQPYKAA